MARPKKQDIEKRSEQVKIRLTLAEAEHLRALSASSGVSLADYVRRRALSAPLPSHHANRSDPALVSEINRVGVNVNQLARSVHRGSDFSHYWREIGAEVKAAMAEVLAHDS